MCHPPRSSSGSAPLIFLHSRPQHQLWGPQAPVRGASELLGLGWGECLWGLGSLTEPLPFLDLRLPGLLLRTTILPGFIDTNRQANVKVRGVTLPDHRHRHRHGPRGGGRTGGALGRAQSRGEGQVPDTGVGGTVALCAQEGAGQGPFSGSLHMGVVGLIWGVLQSLTDMALTIGNGQRRHASISEIKA